jgi:hypothetical protein
VSDKTFLERASENTLSIYEHVMAEVESRTGPVIEYYEVEDTQERRVVVGYKMGKTKRFFRCVLLPSSSPSFSYWDGCVTDVLVGSQCAFGSVPLLRAVQRQEIRWCVLYAMAHVFS